MMSEYIDERPAPAQNNEEQAVDETTAAPGVECAAGEGPEPSAEASLMPAETGDNDGVKGESGPATADESFAALSDTAEEGGEGEAVEACEKAEPAESVEKHENETALTEETVPTENTKEEADSEAAGTEAEVDAVVSKISSLLFTQTQPEKTSDNKTEEEAHAGEKAPEMEDGGLWRNISPERMEELRSEEYARRQRRRDMGLCQYCGGEVEKQLLDWRCSVCGMKKDYK